MLSYIYPMIQRVISPALTAPVKLLLVVLALLPASFHLSAQHDDTPEKVIQISGRVMTEEDGKLDFLPYAVVGVQGTNRGTLTDLTGFFSIAVRTNETLVFSVLGFKEAFYTVPDTLTRDRYTIYQMMYRDTFLLPEAVIYPWPDPNFFTQEFLAMDVYSDLEDIAAENLSEKAMAVLREYLPSDGPEHTMLYFRQRSANYYYEGQIRTPQIFNAFAWKEFIQAWRRGDFKKKKKK
jgi:hypothetical protein